MNTFTLVASLLGITLGLMAGLKLGSLIQKNADNKKLLDYEDTIDSVIEQNQLNAQKIIDLEQMQVDLQKMLDIYKNSI